MHELILGGRKSGKSRCAENRAADWLRTSGHEAMLIATALPGDEEMRERIEHHRRSRSLRLPALQTLEVPRDLAAALRTYSSARILVVVDCLTLWLTQLLMPLNGPALDEGTCQSHVDSLVQVLAQAAGPIVMVSNELGLGVSPLQPETRRYLDRLGELHQRVATLCERVTLMVAGIECRVKP